MGKLWKPIDILYVAQGGVSLGAVWDRSRVRVCGFGKLRGTFFLSLWGRVEITLAVK